MEPEGGNTDNSSRGGRKLVLESKTNFDYGLCVVCGWRGISGIICKHGRCWRRFFYDKEAGFVHAKIRCKISKGQEYLLKQIRGWTTEKIYQEAIFPWSIGCKSVGYRYDIVIPAYKLLVEYDSVIHNKFNKHFHKTKAKYYASQLRDQAKDEMAARNGWALIRVNEDNPAGSFKVKEFFDKVGKDGK